MRAEIECPLCGLKFAAEWHGLNEEAEQSWPRAQVRIQGIVATLGVQAAGDGEALPREAQRRRAAAWRCAALTNFFGLPYLLPYISLPQPQPHFPR
jgi:hypothetical protein